jgi:hypothetical protein
VTISSTLSWESGIAAGAAKDAAALRDLLDVLKQVGNAPGLGGGGGGDKASAKLAGDLLKIKAKEAADIAKVQAKGDQDIARVQAQGAAKLAQQEQASVARDIAQRNAAMAKLVQIQAKGAQDRAREEAKGEQQRVLAAQKAAADIEKIKAKEAADIAKINAKEAANAGKGGGSPHAPAGGGGGGPAADTSFSLGAIAGGADLGALQAVLGVYEEILGKVASLLEKFGGLAIKAVSFKETTTLAFQGLLGSEEASKAYYEKALDLADAIGLDKGDVVQKLSRLLTAGFDKEGALAAVKAVADVTQVLGESAGNKLQSVLTKIQAGGKISQREISALKAIGISTADVYEQIGKRIGKSAKDAEAAVKAGQVNAKVAEEAIEDVVGKKFGGLAEKAGKTVPRLLGDIVDEFERLFDNINIDPFRDTLKGISDFLTGDLGKDLKEGITELGSALFELFFGPFKDGSKIQDVGKVVTDVVKQIAGWVKSITPGIHAFVEGFIEGFKKLGPIAGKAGGEIISFFAKILSNKLMLQQWGQALGTIVGALGILLDVVLAVMGAVTTFGAAAVTIASVIINIWAEMTEGIIGLASDAWAWVKGIFSGWGSDGESAGNALGEGLTNGLYNSLSGALDAAGTVASQIIARVKGILGIASPSTVFAEIGGYTVAGFSNAVNDNAHHAARAAGDMARGAADAAAGASFGGPLFGPAAGRGARAGVGGGLGSITIGPFHIGAGAAAAAGGDAALARMIADQVEVVIRRYAEAA